MNAFRYALILVSLLGGVAAHATEESAGKEAGVSQAAVQVRKVREDETPTPEKLAIVKSFAVSGKLTKVVGHFSSFGMPMAGDTFELDLANLPEGKISFTRPDNSRAPSYIAFSVPLVIEGIRRQVPVTKPGRGVIHLSARDAASGRTFLIWVVAERLEKSGKVTVLFSQSGDGSFIGGMAEAEGVLKERGAVTGDFAGFENLSAAAKDQLIWELHDKHKWGAPEQKPICRYLLEEQGTASANHVAWTTDAIDMAEKQGWKELNPHIQRIYERPQDVWGYERAFRYLRAAAGQEIPADIPRTADVLRTAGSHQSLVTDEDLAKAKATLIGAADKEAVLVNCLSVALGSEVKGGSRRGREAAANVLRSLGRETVAARIEQLRRDTRETERGLLWPQLDWLADYLGYPGIAAETKDDPIGRLAKRLNDSHGINGLSPSLDLPPTASSDEVLLRIIARSRLGTNVRTLEIRKDVLIQVTDAKVDSFTAALVEVDAGKRIILFRRDGDEWWSRVFDLP